MGKRTGAAVRRKKRIDATVEEHLEEKIEREEVSKLESKANDDLFVIDMEPHGAAPGKKSKSTTTSASKQKSSKSTSIVSEKLKRSKKHRISDLDEQKITKLIAAHSKEGVVALASKTHTKHQVERKRSNRGKTRSNATFDLWSNDNGSNSNASEKAGKKMIPVRSGVKSMAGTAPIEFKLVSTDSLRKDIQQPAPLSNKLRKAREIFSSTAKKTVPIEVAQPGQSYRPDEEQHQDVIGEALSIEIRRKEAQDKQKEPIGGGQMMDETLALLVNSDDESEDSEDEVEDDSTRQVKNEKKKEKITDKQRNKRKRAKALEVEHKEKKKMKKLLNSIHDAKRFSKELQQEEEAQLARRMEIRSLKEEKKAEPLGINVFENISNEDPLNTPALPVALTSELNDNGGSLRAMKPKGSLLTDRMESMVSRKMVNTRVREKKNIVQGKKRKMKGGKGREYLLV